MQTKILLKVPRTLITDQLECLHYDRVSNAFYERIVNDLLLLFKSKFKNAMIRNNQANFSRSDHVYCDGYTYSYTVLSRYFYSNLVYRSVREGWVITLQDKRYSKSHLSRLAQEAEYGNDQTGPHPTFRPVLEFFNDSLKAVILSLIMRRRKELIISKGGAGK